MSKVKSQKSKVQFKIQDFSTTYHPPGIATPVRQRLRRRRMPGGRSVSGRGLPPITCQIGFTLIEILVTVAILGIISTAAISIFTSMSAAYNKSSIINELREEGSRVMDNMERLVRSSSDAASGGSSVLILTLNTGSLEYQQNGQCKTLTLTLGSATADKNNFINKALSDCEGVASGAGEMTNTNRTSGVNVSALTFSVTGSGPKVVKIYLTLEQGLSAAARQDYQASVNLETTVSTRSY